MKVVASGQVESMRVDVCHGDVEEVKIHKSKFSHLNLRTHLYGHNSTKVKETSV